MIATSAPAHAPAPEASVLVPSLAGEAPGATQAGGSPELKGGQTPPGPLLPSQVTVTLAIMYNLLPPAITSSSTVWVSITRLLQGDLHSSFFILHPCSSSPTFLFRRILAILASGLEGNEHITMLQWVLQVPPLLSSSSTLQPPSSCPPG